MLTSAAAITRSTRSKVLDNNNSTKPLRSAKRARATAVLLRKCWYSNTRQERETGLLTKPAGGATHHHISRLLSVYPSFSNAGRQANLIMGGGPHTSTCRSTPRVSAEQRQSRRTARACVLLRGGGRCASTCATHVQQRQPWNVDAQRRHKQARAHTISGEMKPVPKAQPAGGRSSV